MNNPPDATILPLGQRNYYIVTKAVGSICNLNCIYCYYRSKDHLLHNEKIVRMDDALLEKFIKSFITEIDNDSVPFNWHGGEPTLLGLDFYKRVVELQKKYADGKTIKNDIQTNGTLIDDAWCRFFKENDFTVGLSIDGPKHLHDRFRTAHGGESTFDVVHRAAKMVQQYEVSLSVLTVVNALNSQHPDDVYHYLADELGCRHLQWIPCVDPKNFAATSPARWNVDRLPTTGSSGARPGNPDSFVTDWSVDPEAWGYFLSRTFYLWLKHGYGKVFIHWFESLVAQWMGQPALICTLAKVCGRSLVTIEKDGSVYSCDRFVYPDYLLGNLRDEGRSLAEMVYSPRQFQFGCAKYDTLPQYCRECPYLFACHGECPKNRFVKTPDGQPGLNYLCPGLKSFFAYADPYLRQIADRILAKQGVVSENLVAPDQENLR